MVDAAVAFVSPVFQSVSSSRFNSWDHVADISNPSFLPTWPGSASFFRPEQRISMKGQQ